MPTGYTTDVADGKVTDFRTFALRCARAFGAVVEQRDEAMDAPPRLREPSDHYRERLDAEVARLTALVVMTPEQIEAAALGDYLDRVKSWERSRERSISVRVRYESMQADILAWNPPTAEHVALKKFMLDQIDDSIRFDCLDADFRAPDPKDAAAWHASAIASAARSIEHTCESMAKDRANVDGSNKWITALYESLPEATND